MRYFLLTAIAILIGYSNLTFAQVYFGFHYTAQGGGPISLMKAVFRDTPDAEADEINICKYDNGNNNDCADNYPSILNSDNSTTASNSTTRYFEEKLRPTIGTVRLSLGYATSLLPRSVFGLGFKFGLTGGVYTIDGKKNSTIFEGYGLLRGGEIEVSTLHDKLSLFGFFPFYRRSYTAADVIHLYILGSNLSGQRYVRKTGKMYSDIIEYGGSFEIRLFGINPKQNDPRTGVYFDIYKSDHQSKLEIDGDEFPLRTVTYGYSLKFSKAF